MVSSAAAATGALLLSRPAEASQADRGGAGWDKSYSGGAVDAPAQPPGQPGQDYTPVPSSARHDPAQILVAGVLRHATRK